MSLSQIQPDPARIRRGDVAVNLVVTFRGEDDEDDEEDANLSETLLPEWGPTVAKANTWVLWYCGIGGMVKWRVDWRSSEGLAAFSKKGPPW